MSADYPLCLCLCGAQSGYSHPSGCPYPLYRGTEAQEHAWQTARIALREPRPPELEPIDVNLYEPHPEHPTDYGYLRVKGRRSMRWLLDEINRRLKALDLEPDEYGFNATLARAKHRLDQPVPPYRWVACFPVTGSSEGHYVHVDFIVPFDLLTVGTDTRIRTHDVREVAGSLLEGPPHSGYISGFLAKTFLGMDHACKIANAVARMLG